MNATARDLRRVKWQRPTILLLLVMACLLINACVAPFAAPTPSIATPPVSPLIPGKNATLAENRWRVVQIQYQGKAVVFDAVGPIHISFAKEGALSIWADCPGGGYWIDAQDETHYRLYGGEFSAVQCDPLVSEQFTHVNAALVATTAYTIQGKQLFLTGEGVLITLELDNPD